MRVAWLKIFTQARPLDSKNEKQTQPETWKNAIKTLTFLAGALFLALFDFESALLGAKDLVTTDLKRAMKAQQAPFYATAAGFDGKRFSWGEKSPLTYLHYVKPSRDKGSTILASICNDFLTIK